MEQHSKQASLAVGAWGILSVIYGVMVIAWPVISLKVFLIILGIYLVASGLALVMGSLVGRSGHWVAGVLMGGFSVVAALYVFANPGISALATLTVIAIWSMVVGLLQIMVGFEAKDNDWWLVLVGAIQLLFGFYIFANPGGGALALVWLIGLTAVINGVVLAAAAFRHKSLAGSK